MPSILFPPSFLSGFIALTGVYISSYLVGFFAKKIFNYQSIYKVHNEFSNLIIGYFIILFLYVVIKTSGETIFLGLIIPAVILILKRPKGNKNSSTFVFDKTILFTHLFFLLLFFSISYLSSYNPFTGNLIERNIDCLIYGRFSELIDVTGEENPFLDWYMPLDQGSAFYHYGDLWGGALANWLSGLGYYYGLYFVAFPFAVIMACWAWLSLLESAGYRLKIINILLCSTLVILTPFNQQWIKNILFAPVFKSGIVLLMEFARKLLFTYTMPIIFSPKIAFVLIFFLWALRQINIRDFSGGFLVFGVFIILFSTMLPPVIFTLFFFGLILILRKTARIREVFIWAFPVLSLLFFLLFYYMNMGGAEKLVSATSPKDSLLLFLQKDVLFLKLETVMVMILTTFIGLVPFLPFLSLINFKSFPVFFSFFTKPSTIFFFIFLFSGLFSVFIFYPIFDSFQFWQVPCAMAVGAGVLWLLVKTFNRKGYILLKIYSFCAVVLLGWQNIPLASNINGKNKEFFEKLVSVTGSENLKFAYCSNPPDSSNYILKYIATYHPFVELAQFVKKYRPVCITIRDFSKERDPFAVVHSDVLLKNSDFFRYVDELIKQGKFISETESKISFIREKDIHYVCMTADFHPDSLFERHLVPEFTSPDGITFCHFIEIP